MRLEDYLNYISGPSHDPSKLEAGKDFTLYSGAGNVKTEQRFEGSDLDSWIDEATSQGMLTVTRSWKCQGKVYPEPLWGVQPSNTDFGCVVPKTVRGYISVVLRYNVYGNLLHQPQETCMNYPI